MAQPWALTYESSAGVTKSSQTFTIKSKLQNTKALPSVGVGRGGMEFLVQAAVESERQLSNPTCIQPSQDLWAETDLSNQGDSLYEEVK